MFSRRVAMAFVLASPVLVAAQASSPYTGQELRSIKALSAEDTAALLAGKGMGLAKAAELNGYPGPAHVLELAAPLALTPEQRSRTQALFDSMESGAQALGRALVEQERRLDTLFATKSVTPELLKSALSEIGALQAQVRAAHLQAHLDQVAILTPQQVAHYARLRGYAGSTAPAHSGHKH
jgi:Spy/CpxP family protein refolding chaperone